MNTASSIALDLFALAVDMASLLSLLVVGIVGVRAVRAFRQSKQAVTESASLVSVIVDALVSRIQRSESAVVASRSDIAAATRRSETLEGDQAALHASQEKMMRQLQDALSNDKKLIAELEHLKLKLAEIQQGGRTGEGLPKPENVATLVSEGDVLTALTPTERRTLEILKVEGAKAAPELGRRLNKSREHTSRLMKKLYMEGYVSRESNRAPFRYRLNDVVRPALEIVDSGITEARPETP
jgi:uncharacterized membrane protein